MKAAQFNSVILIPASLIMKNHFKILSLIKFSAFVMLNFLFSDCGIADAKPFYCNFTFKNKPYTFSQGSCTNDFAIFGLHTKVYLTADGGKRNKLALYATYGNINLTLDSAVFGREYGNVGSYFTIRFRLPYQVPPGRLAVYWVMNYKCQIRLSSLTTER